MRTALLLLFILLLPVQSAGCPDVYKVNASVGNFSTIPGSSAGVLCDFYSTKRDIVDTNMTIECVYNNSFVYRTYYYIYLGRVQPRAFFRVGQVVYDPATFTAANYSCWCHCGSYTDTYYYANGLYSNFTWAINQICGINGCYNFTFENYTLTGDYFTSFSENKAYFNYYWVSLGLINVNEGNYDDYFFKTTIYDYNDTIIEQKVTNFDSTTVITQEFLINDKFEINGVYHITQEIYTANETKYTASNYFRVFENNDSVKPIYHFNETDKIIINDYDVNTVFIGEEWIIYDKLYQENAISGTIPAVNVKCSIIIYDYDNHEIHADYGEDTLFTSTKDFIREKRLITNDGGELIHKIPITIKYLYNTNYTAVLKCGNAEKKYLLMIRQARDYNEIFNILNWFAEHRVIVTLSIFCFFSLIFLVVILTKFTKTKKDDLI